MLQTSARIFDPINSLTPFTIRVKCLFQELWERGVGWDEQLPPDLADKRVSGVQSCHSSTSWPFQGGTKSKHNHTHRYPNYTSFAMLVIGLTLHLQGQNK